MKLIKAVVELTESTGSQYCGNEPDREVDKDDIWIQPYQVCVFGEVIPNRVSGALGGSHELAQLPIGWDARGWQARWR